MNCEKSITGQYLSGRKKIPVPQKRRKGNGKFLEVRGAAENNLNNINVKIPLGEFVCVTGVSGSGKSSLVNEIIYKRLAAQSASPASIGKCSALKTWTRSLTLTNRR